MKRITLGNSSIRAIPKHVVLILLVIFALGPFTILIFNSLKSSAELSKNPLGPPHAFVWENYPKAWERGGFSKTVRNSSFLVVMTVAGVLSLGGMAAYALAKLKLPEADFLMIYLLVVSTLPIQLFLIPLFFLWRKIGLINTLPGLSIIYIAMNAPFAIFLMRSYIVQIPPDFDDAARVDGANEFQVFSRIVVPLTWPAFLTTGLVVALNVWNELVLATIFLQNKDLFTVVTSYFAFTQRFGLRDWGLTSASAVMMVTPIVIIFLIMQRRFIEGLTQGGLKM
jgi:raffinose/stachyose/melibiose transport system permease protein